MNSVNVFCADGTRINVGRGVTKETKVNYIQLTVIDREGVETSDAFWGGDLSCMENFLADNVKDSEDYIDDVVDACWKWIVL